MKQVSRRAGGCVAVLLGAIALSGGCTDDSTGFFILGNVKIEAPECIASADSGAVLLITGELDVALRPDYVATLLVGSQLAPRGDKANLRTETMISTVTGAEVELYKDTGELDTRFTVPASGVIVPDGGDDPGFGIITATLIPASSGVALAEELTDRAQVRTRVAKVSVFGKTIGGLDVESAPFSYVIRVCEGCLVEFPAGAYDPTTGCVPSSSGESVVPPCHPGQDDALDCRYCSSQNDFCRYPGGTPPP